MALRQLEKWRCAMALRHSLLQGQGNININASDLKADSNYNSENIGFNKRRSKLKVFFHDIYKCHLGH